MAKDNGHESHEVDFTSMVARQLGGHFHEISANTAKKFNSLVDVKAEEIDIGKTKITNTIESLVSW